MMDENKSLITIFFNQVFLTFGLAIIAISIVGWSVGDVTKGTVSLLSLGCEGLSYKSLLQVFIFSFFEGIITLIFNPNLFIKKMMLLWRIVLVFAASLVLAIVCSILFHWFPTGNFLAWIGFIASTTVGFMIGLIYALIKIRLENKKYNELLTNYKKNQKGDDEK
ncbi:MAG: hypothetical protein FWC47_08925 [Oscillospiraceae bacterium]|nr:hypothetical protein [Oscillospiraceae bacterium]